MSIVIQPSTTTTTKIITSFTVNIVRLELFQSVTVNAMLFGIDNNFIDVKTITLSGQDYQNWDNNDQYLIDKVAEILGFTLNNVSEPTVPEPSVPEPSEPEPEPSEPEPSEPQLSEPTKQNED